MTTHVEIAKAVQSKIEGMQEDFGIADVFYGDQPFPRTPTVCVETGPKTSELNAAPRRAERSHTVYVLLYHNDLSTPATNREENDALAESLETLLNSDRTLGGLAVHCMVTSLEPGYAVRDSTIYQATRITFEATTLEMLPS